jgi:hypothetical protein
VGLSLLVRPLRAAGHEVEILDLMKVEGPDGALVEAIAEVQPDIVGFSLRNLDNQEMGRPRNFVPDYVRWVALANEHAPTIIGGSAVMSAPEALLERTEATYAMDGQAVRALPHFLDELESGRRGGFTAPGLLWREGGEVRANPGELNGYGEDGSIDWSVIDMDRYRSSFGNLCVITKTGCPYRCVFCDAEVSFGPEFVPREPAAIADDLRRDAAVFGMKGKDCFLVDALFNEPLDWAKAVLEEFIRLDHRLLFSAVIEPTTQFDQEFADLLRRAGCGVATCLIGSWSDEVMAKSRRPFTTASAHRALGMLERAGVPYMVYYLLGGPGETRETVLANAKHNKRRRPIYNYASVGQRINPKSGLYDIAVDDGAIEAEADLLEPRFYLSPELRDDVDWLKAQAKQLGRPRLSALPQWARYMARALAVRFQGFRS